MSEKYTCTIEGTGELFPDCVLDRGETCTESAALIASGKGKESCEYWKCLECGHSAGEGCGCPQNECTWIENEDRQFSTGCGHCFELSNLATVEENGIKFCCYCGRSLALRPEREGK